MSHKSHGVPDAATKNPAFGAILIVKKKEKESDDDNYKLGGYFNMKLKACYLVKQKL